MTDIRLQFIKVSLENSGIEDSRGDLVSELGFVSICVILGHPDYPSFSLIDGNPLGSDCDLLWDTIRAGAPGEEDEKESAWPVHIKPKMRTWVMTMQSMLHLANQAQAQSIKTSTITPSGGEGSTLPIDMYSTSTETQARKDELFANELFKFAERVHSLKIPVSERLHYSNVIAKHAKGLINGIPVALALSATFISK